MKKIILFIVFAFFLIPLVFALDFQAFFNNLQDSPEDYFVYYEGSDSIILSESNNLANTLGIEFSSILLPNKNYIAIVVPPELFGFLYYYENNFSSLQVIDWEEADILAVYLSNSSSSSEEFSLNRDFIFNYLKGNSFSNNTDFLKIQKGSAVNLESFYCSGFGVTSNETKNIFEINGDIFEDECLDQKILLKMVCDDFLVYEEIVCENYCFEGRCVLDLDFISEARKWVFNKDENYFQRILRFLFSN